MCLSCHHVDVNCGTAISEANEPWKYELVICDSVCICCAGLLLNT